MSTRREGRIKPWNMWHAHGCCILGSTKRDGAGRDARLGVWKLMRFKAGVADIGDCNIAVEPCGREVGVAGGGLKGKDALAPRTAVIFFAIRRVF